MESTKVHYWTKRSGDVSDMYAWCVLSKTPEFKDNPGLNFFKLYWHKEDEPAYIDGNSKEYWYLNDRHRYDGVAIILYENGKEISYDNHWYIHGENVSGKEYKEWLDIMGMDIDNLTPEDKMIIDMKWGP